MALSEAGSPQAGQAAADLVILRNAADGGWRDKPNGASGGWATGMAVYALQKYDPTRYAAEIESGRNFLLRPKVLELGAAYLESMNIETLTKTYLEDLARRTGRHWENAPGGGSCRPRSGFCRRRGLCATGADPRATGHRARRES